ncbi:hypothetical protein KVR01_003251 [Diaporthe batatas]|uniref:uncharacterized protein n=1 Tax=Diaporthe batatas TaxID=748121 RepID=UPI001D03AF57|nr:uncharacterized protein KVR01_003251 [Diaporthe batatas]KAG8167562.1 hypothetical protein KVR01_003251 [Diaporthe batatas]
MPPKKTTSSSAEGGDGAIAALCHVLMNCDDFKIDTHKLAPILGVSHPKNVPRKINGIISPYGFEFKGGKVVQSGSQAPAGTAGPSSAPENGKGEKTKARQGPAPKKRKLADDDDSSDKE